MGVSISAMCTLASNCMIVTLYSWRISEYHIAPFPTNIRSLLTAEEVKIYLSISGPSILMLLAETLSVEILIIMAASISIGASGAIAISYSYFYVMWSFP